MISEDTFWCIFFLGVIILVILSFEVHKDDDEYWN